MNRPPPRMNTRRKFNAPARLAIGCGFFIALLFWCTIFGSIVSALPKTSTVQQDMPSSSQPNNVAQVSSKATATSQTSLIKPTATPRPKPTMVPTDTPIPTDTPQPIPTQVPTIAPTQPPLPTPTPLPTNPPQPTPTPAPVHTGVNGNPWGYDFNPGSAIYSPPSAFCSYFSCINNFLNGHGYVEECSDGMYSLSGGVRGVCSYHGGAYRELYSHP